jgi:hypothetical protein
MIAVRASLRLSVAVFLVCVAGSALASSSVAAGTLNACKLLGATRALAADVFGKGANVGSAATTGGTPPNLGAYCVMSQGPRAVRFIGGISLEPYAAAEFSALVASYGSPLTQTPLKRLGAGAVFAHDRDPSQDVIEFERGKDAVLISSEEAAGEPAKDYPTEKMYLTVAHAVYAHLR